MNPSEQPAILEAIEISKSYGSRRALDRISLRVRPGEIAGLLGPNGAGKTTTLSILSALLRPDSGRVLIDGKPPGANPRRLPQMIGLVPQSLALYPSLSAEQNVRHFARMQGLSRSDASAACVRVLKDVGLADRAGDPMRSFSSGMKRRLNLACGLVHRPAVLLLDEPTVGVDLQSREQILSLVRGCANAGSAVIYSTHYMEEAERICDRVMLLDRGIMIADGSIDKVISLGGARPRMELTCRGPFPEPRLRTLPEVRRIEASGEQARITLEMTSLAQVSEVLQQLQAMGLHVIDFSLHSPNLSDAFIALTGRSLRDDDADAG